MLVQTSMTIQSYVGINIEVALCELLTLIHMYNRLSTPNMLQVILIAVYFMHMQC